MDQKSILSTLVLNMFFKRQIKCFRHNCGMEANCFLLVNCLVETVLTFCFVLCLFKKKVSKYKNHRWHRERTLK